MKRILLVILTIIAVESTEVLATNRRTVPHCAETVVVQQRLPREQRRQLSRRDENAERLVRHRDGEEEGATNRTHRTTRNEIALEEAEGLNISLHPLAETLAVLLRMRNITNNSARQLNYILSDEHAPSRRAILESLVAESHRQYPLNSVYNSLWAFINALQQEPVLQVLAAKFTMLMCALTTTGSHATANPFANILFRDVFGLDPDTLTPEIISLASTVCSHDEENRYGAFIDMVAKLYPNGEITQTFLERIITRARSNQDLEAFFS